MSDDMAQLAQVYYSAWGAAVGFRTPGGEPQPRWDSLPPAHQNAIKAGVAAVIKAYGVAIADTAQGDVVIPFDGEPEPVDDFKRRLIDTMKSTLPQMTSLGPRHDYDLQNENSALLKYWSKQVIEPAGIYAGAPVFRIVGQSVLYRLVNGTPTALDPIQTAQVQGAGGSSLVDVEMNPPDDGGDDITTLEMRAADLVDDSPIPRTSVMPKPASPPPTPAVNPFMTIEQQQRAAVQHYTETGTTPVIDEASVYGRLPPALEGDDEGRLMPIVHPDDDPADLPSYTLHVGRTPKGTVNDYIQDVVDEAMGREVAGIVSDITGIPIVAHPLLGDEADQDAIDAKAKIALEELGRVHRLRSGGAK